MQIHLLAVGLRLPDWVNQGYQEFARRLPREFSLQLVEIKPASRISGKTALQLKAEEAERIRSALPKNSYLVALDEHGRDLSTRALAKTIGQWQMLGQDIAIIIGGPDGLDDSLLAQAGQKIRLSSLTLPHALVRPLIAEALYRAWSLQQGHPYHRE